jgi:transposase
LAHLEQLEGSIAQLDAQVDRVLVPFAQARDQLDTITGGKRRSGTTTKGNRWLGEVLIECAWAAARSRDTYLVAQYWRLARRIGKKRAAIAVGHSIS